MDGGGGGGTFLQTQIINLYFILCKNKKDHKLYLNVYEGQHSTCIPCSQHRQAQKLHRQDFILSPGVRRTSAAESIALWSCPIHAEPNDLLRWNATLMLSLAFTLTPHSFGQLAPVPGSEYILLGSDPGTGRGSLPTCLPRHSWLVLQSFYWYNPKGIILSQMLRPLLAISMTASWTWRE